MNFIFIGLFAGNKNLISKLVNVSELCGVGMSVKARLAEVNN